MNVLQVEELQVSFRHSAHRALDGVSLQLAAGRRLGLIGESGSGKSLTALATMGLLPDTAQASGLVQVAGVDMLNSPERVRAKVRGNDISMVFQEPMTALDPTMRIGEQVAEVRRLHSRDRRAHEHARTMLEAVGLPDPSAMMKAYPHELSGGQRQRVVMAMALVNSPQVVVCDEPTTALDVTVQARVLSLLDRVLTEVGAACLFISHDLAVVAQICDEIAVMWQGQIVESGPVAQILQTPEHPYTRGLLATAKITEVAPGQRLPVVEDFFDREAHHG